MTPERLLRELQRALERIPRPRNEFDVAQAREGWVRVTHRGRCRHYPLTPEIGVLLTGDVRRGAFD
jgi:hypothetical protein